MDPLSSSSPPLVLFGAFDRHNFGDLLFPHIVAALLPAGELHYGGVVASDLTAYGGHRVRAIGELARELGDRPVNLIHVGGELLTCEAWQAAVMVMAPEQAPAMIARLARHPDERVAWTEGQLGRPALAPYCVERACFSRAGKILYNAVGGVELAERPEPFRTEVLEKLRAADYVSVRDGETYAQLQAVGIGAQLIPDPVVMVAELFGGEISRHSERGEVAALRAQFPQGYLALQFSADFGDDATLMQLAQQLEQLVAATGYGLVLFRAGAAPWHDDLASYRRLAGLIKSSSVRLFSSLDIWEICGLIAHSQAYCGSSLHGRIVAMACGLPRLNITHPHQASRTGKQTAYAATWELPGLPHAVEIEGLATGVEEALAADHEQLQNHARTLSAKYREAFTTIYALLSAPP